MLTLTLLLPLQSFSQTTLQPPTTPSASVCIPYQKSVVIIRSLKDYEGLKKRYAARLAEIQKADQLISTQASKSAYQDSVIRSQTFQLYLREDQVSAYKALNKSYKRRLVKSKVLNGLLFLGIGTLTYLSITR